jgi:pimeloyl-ACP methyl ester carboxylesterase
MRDPLQLDGVRFDHRMIDVEDGLSIRVLHWRPGSSAKAPPVVFVPGWVSLVDGWIEVLRTMVTDREVVYVETREKATARWRRPMAVDDFRIPKLADDLRAAWDAYDLGDRAVLFGSSLGGNAILEALKGSDPLPAAAAFCICPNIRFEIPWWGHPLLRMPATVYRLAVEPAIWYLRRFRVNTRHDPAQMRRYERTLRAAEPTRLLRSARAVVGYDARPALDTVTAPVALAYSEADTLHGGEQVRELADAIPDARTIGCASNTAMHRAEVVDALDEFVAQTTRSEERGDRPCRAG